MLKAIFCFLFGHSWYLEATERRTCRRCLQSQERIFNVNHAAGGPRYFWRMPK